MGHKLTQKKGVTEDNKTLVQGKYGKTLNAACYNCRNLGHLEFNFPAAGFTGTCSLYVTHIFSQNQIQKNDPINENRVLLVT